MSKVQPDIAPQLGMLNRYAKVLLPVFAEIGSKKAMATSLDPMTGQKVCANLDPLKVIIHNIFCYSKYNLNFLSKFMKRQFYIF